MSADPTVPGESLFNQTKKRSGQPIWPTSLLPRRNLKNASATVSVESTVTPNSALRAFTGRVAPAAISLVAISLR